MASNVPGYKQPQCFVVEEEGREAALQTVATFVEHLERIAEQAGQLEQQRFAPLLKGIEETWGVSYQPSPSSASVPEQEQEQEERDMGESTGFDQDSSDDESEEDDDEETEEDQAFIDDDDLEDEEEDDLSFYRRVDLQLPEQWRPLALSAAPVQTTNRLLKKGNDC